MRVRRIGRARDLCIYVNIALLFIFGTERVRSLGLKKEASFIDSCLNLVSSVILHLYIIVIKKNVE